MFADSAPYERFMGRWSRHLAPLLVKFAGVRDLDDVLDVGSGTGALSFAIAQGMPSAHVTGIDPAAAYVADANAHAPTERIRFLVGDAQQLQFSDRTFDRVLSLLVMNFIPDASKALFEMVRVTRHGGVIAAAVWDYGAGMQMLRIFWDEAVRRDSSAGPRDERHMRLCRQGELSALWRTHGLLQVEEQPLTIPLSFASFEDYWSPFVGGQGPAGAYVATLAEDDRESLRRQLRRRLLGEGAADRAITLQARAWAVKGVALKGLE